MILNNINFPNELLESIQNNELVVFAGAGVSMGNPTNLPSFDKLSEEIVNGTGKTKENESCEVFLGKLKVEGIDVNQMAADILLEKCPKYNEMHNAIISLFETKSNIRIVTTNYDQMFERVLEEEGLDIAIYNTPALPLGDDVKGIVHLHGNVDDSKHMVLTDEDFGKAYLTEGYATRFLIKLFQTYNILFIGYSYNDTILRYLTRAIDITNGKKRYILTDNTEDKDNWNTLSIDPIYFPEKNYELLKEGLKKLGERGKRNLLEWKNQFEEFAEKPPEDVSILEEVEYCLSKSDIVAVMSMCIKGKEWFNLLENKNIFEKIFSKHGQILECDKIWIKWIINKIIGTHDEVFLKTLLKRNNAMHQALVNELVERIISEGQDIQIDNRYLGAYIALIKEYEISPYNLCGLIEICKGKNMYDIYQILFTKFFELSFVVQEDAIYKEISYTHCFRGRDNYIMSAWEICKETLFSKNIEYWIAFALNKINELYNAHVLLNGENRYELYKINGIELRSEEIDDYNPVIILCDIVKQGCKKLENQSPTLLIEILTKCLTSKIILLKRIALIILKELEKISLKDKFDIFINNIDLYDFDMRTEIFFLVENLFNNITNEQKNVLIDKIENDFKEEYSEYQKYNWCVWIKKFCDDNQRIDKIEKDILSRNNYIPCEHPEISSECYNITIVEDKSPISKEEMLNLSKEDLLKKLNEYEGDSDSKTTREGLLNEFLECCRTNFEWGIDIAEGLIKENVQQEDTWKYLIRGIEKNTDTNIEKKLRFLEWMINCNTLVRINFWLCELLRNLLDANKKDESLQNYESRFWKIINYLWDKRYIEKDNGSTLNTVLFNTELGNILVSCINMLFCMKKNGIPSNYKQFFEKNLKLVGYERKIVVYILSGYFGFLCSQDNKWYKNNFESILIGEEKAVFSVAWQGISELSNYLNKNVLDVIAPFYLKAVEHIECLEGNNRDAFINLYLQVLTYAVEDPCDKYIPQFYKYANASDKITFLKKITNRLMKENKDFINSWCTRWLNRYLDNRFNSKPSVLEQEEYSIIMNWISWCPEMLGKIIEYIGKKGAPSKVDRSFLRYLKKNKIEEKYPKEVIQLLTLLLDGRTTFQDFRETDIREIYKNIKEIPEDVLKCFQEACLKWQIEI